ncbi:MAG: ankyrin repeat domain-containing protein [Gemmatimonadota bacterium]
MSIGPLSARINLEQSRKQAKDLVKAFKAGDAEALNRIRWNHPRFRGLKDEQILQRKFVLADAQLVVARSHYIESWSKLLLHIEQLKSRDPRVIRFEDAADAIVSGDIAKLRELLRQHPNLVHERSTRGHRAPLLHYIAANGIEDYRQLSPPNAVEVAQALLDAGADVDATSEAYGGETTALELVATSTPPRRAGVQIPLIDLLLQHGAAIDGLKPRSSVVTAALANNCPEAAEALVKRGAKVKSIVEAAGAGRLDSVKHLADVATSDQLEKALIMAARYGRHEALQYLLDKGVDVAAFDGMTALHHATGRGDLEMVRRLVRRGAPLEKKNAYGGTVLDNTLWFAYDADPSQFARRDYPAVIEFLIAAGARTDVYPEMTKYISGVYERAGKET